MVVKMNHYNGNMKIGFVIEGIADPKDEIEELDEYNNREVLRWWFPLINEPSSRFEPLSPYFE